MRRQTSDIRRQTHISSFRAKREIFVMRGLAASVWKLQKGNPLPSHLRASPHIFAAKPPPSLLIPHSSFLIWVELSSPIKEHHAPGANPEPKTFFKKRLTQERQCGKIIPVADEAARSKER